MYLPIRMSMWVVDGFNLLSRIDSLNERVSLEKETLDMLSAFETLKESIRQQREELANATIQVNSLNEQVLVTLSYGVCAVFLNAIVLYIAGNRLEQDATMLRDKRFIKAVGLVRAFPQRICDPKAATYVMPVLAAQLSMVLFFLSASGLNKALCLSTYLNMLHSHADPKTSADMILHITQMTADIYRKSVYNARFAAWLLALLAIPFVLGLSLKYLAPKGSRIWPVMFLIAQLMAASILTTLWFTLSLVLS